MNYLTCCSANNPLVYNQTCVSNNLKQRQCFETCLQTNENRNRASICNVLFNMRQELGGQQGFPVALSAVLYGIGLLLLQSLWVVSWGPGGLLLSKTDSVGKSFGERSPDMRSATVSLRCYFLHVADCEAPYRLQITVFAWEFLRCHFAV